MLMYPWSARTKLTQTGIWDMNLRELRSSSHPLKIGAEKPPCRTLSGLACGLG